MALYPWGGSAIGDAGFFIVGGANAAVNTNDADLVQRWRWIGALGGMEVYANLPEQPLPILWNTYTIMDTGATIADHDFVTLIHGRPVTDTGATISDTALPTRIVRPLADTGVTISDTVADPTILRVVADTGSTITDAATRSLGAISRTITDTGTSVSDAVGLNTTRVITDTGVTVTDTITTIRQRIIADTGSTITDAVATIRQRAVTDTGVAMSDSLVTVRARPPNDTGTTIADSVTVGHTPIITTTGATITDTVTRAASRTITDTGTAITDALAPITTRLIADTGATITDTVSTARVRSITDTGAAITDSVQPVRMRVITDTGAAITDTVLLTQTRAPLISDSAFGRAVDTFSGTASGSLASPIDTGQSWVNIGSAARWSEGSGNATYAPSAIGTVNAVLPVPNLDGDYYIDFDWSSDPVGATQQALFGVRMQSTANSGTSGYRGVVLKAVGSAGQVRIDRVDSGTPTTIGSAVSVPGDILIATRYRIHINLVGSVISVNVWKVGDPEPIGWQRQATDSTYSTGVAVNIGANPASGNTNLATLHFDNLSVPLTMSDVAAATRVRQISDTGTTITDSVARSAVRNITDTGTVITDTLLPVSSTRSISDAAFTLSDTFSGSASSGWATIQGLAWTKVLGVTANQNEAGGVATIASPSGTGTQTTVMHLPVAAVDGDRYFDFMWDSDAAGASQSFRFFFRAQSNADEQNSYRLTITENAGSGATATIQKLVSGTVTTLFGGSPVTIPGGVTAGTWYRVHLSVVGTALAVNIYSRGTSEPAGWLTSGTDSTYSSGVSIAFGAFITTGNTNRPTFSIDNLSVPIAMSDTITPTISRIIADTGTTISDTVSRAYGPFRAITDTGATITDAVATNRVRTVTSIGATVTDTLSTVRVRNVADTGATITDSATRVANPARTVADTGATITDAVATNRVRTVTSTGATVTDTVSTVRVRVITDTGATITESVHGFASKRVIIDVGSTIVDVIARSTGPGSLTDDLVDVLTSTDTFAGPVDPASWDQDDMGQDWAPYGQNASTALVLAKTGATGTQTYTVPSSNPRWGALATPVAEDCETYAEVEVPACSATGQITFGVGARTDNSLANQLRAVVSTPTGGAGSFTAKLAIRVRRGGSDPANIANAAVALSMTVGDIWCFRFRTIGDTYQAKAWRRGLPEPRYSDSTSVIYTDPTPTYTPGQAGIVGAATVAAGEVITITAHNFRLLQAIGDDTRVGSLIVFPLRSPTPHDATYLNEDWTSSRPGAWFGYATNQTGTQTTRRDMQTGYLQRESDLGRRVDFFMQYYRPTDFAQFAIGNMLWMTQIQGKLFNYISYPLGASVDPVHVVTVPDINAGVWDDTFAADIAAMATVPGSRYLLRPFWEMNGSNSHWNKIQYGNDPSQFIAAWRRFWTIIYGDQTAWTALGITGTPLRLRTTQFKLCWCPGRGQNTGDDPGIYYPGDSYVHWIGRDTYPHPPHQANLDDFLLTSFNAVAGSGFDSSGVNDWYDTWKVKGKPMMLGEFGFAPIDQYTEPASDGIMRTRAQQWQYLLDHLPNYPLLRLVCYFDSPGPGLTDPWSFDYDDGYAGDSGAASMTAAATAVSKPGSYLNPVSNTDQATRVRPPHNITDTGTHINDSVRRFTNRRRFITDTGATISDTLGGGGTHTLVRPIEDWAFTGTLLPQTLPFTLIGGEMSDTVVAYVQTPGTITTGVTTATPFADVTVATGLSGITAVSTTGAFIGTYLPFFLPVILGLGRAMIGTGTTSVAPQSGRTDLSPLAGSNIVTNTRTSGKTDLSPLTGQTEALT